MSLYDEYLNQIEDRKAHGLHPKPVDGADLLAEIVAHMSDADSAHRADCLDFFITNVLPGTTSAAGLKAQVLKDVITGARTIEGISAQSAFEQLSHMKGGPSIEVLLDLLLGDDAGVSEQAADVLKTQ
ncbi:MAG: bifunctional aconitate hydratase 2/2-methylisocitrate dehydratase, partial [Actinomycetota bacterium]